jgi:hypothetical protein
MFRPNDHPSAFGRVMKEQDDVAHRRDTVGGEERLVGTGNLGGDISRVILECQRAEQVVRSNDVAANVTGATCGSQLTGRRDGLRRLRFR